MLSYFHGALNCWGFAPRKRQRNGNPSWGAPGYSVRQKGAKQRGKNRGKKDLPGFFLFKPLPYLKCKITFDFLIYFSPYFWTFLSFLPGCFAISHPMSGFNLLLKSSKSLGKLECRERQTRMGRSGWMNLKNALFWVGKTLLFYPLPHSLLHRKGFSVQTETRRHPRVAALITKSFDLSLRLK